MKERERERKKKYSSARMIESRPCLNNWGSPSVANFFRLGSSLPATFFLWKKKKNISIWYVRKRCREKNREEKKGVCFYIVDHYKNLKNTHNGQGKKKRSWAVFKYIHMNKSLKRVSPFFCCCCSSSRPLVQRTKLRHAGWWWRAVRVLPYSASDGCLDIFIRTTTI